MNLSERKLYSLEPPVGGRDAAILLKGVLVREAVRSAWRSVESGQQVEVNNWQSEAAMGLDVIGEEDEEEEDEDVIVEEKNERWFEELVQSFADDDGVEEHEWAESEVGTPIDYDEFDQDEFEHYTLPSPPPASPTQLPTSPSLSASSLSPLSSPPTPSFTLGLEPEPADIEATTYVDEIDDEYDDYYGYETEVSSGPVQKDSIPSTPLLSASVSPSSSPIPLISLLDDDLECDDLTLPPTLLRRVSMSAPCTPIPIGYVLDDGLDCDDLTLPPALHRCSSTLSVPCQDCEDCDNSDDDCLTPPLSSDRLELSVGSILSLANEVDDCFDSAQDDGFSDHVVEKEKSWSRVDPILGLGLDMGLDDIRF